ncbi:MAG TPA: outer membrane beta-barrel protein [Candidatus Acidoferrum sp.]|nr:outer membrane beta-barrel protein [Candidatus Acidoferrum sp.]
MSSNRAVIFVSGTFQYLVGHARRLEREAGLPLTPRAAKTGRDIAFPLNAGGWLAKALIVCGLMVGFTAPVYAQLRAGITNPLEVGGGYAYTRGYPADGSSGFDLNGGTASLAYRFGDRIALVGDFGVYHFNNSGPGITSTMYTYLFGPRLVLRHSGGESRFAPFTQVLVGGGRLNASTVGISAGENSFALAAGGGLDINSGGHFAFRIIEAEYLMTRFAHPDGSSATQNNVRISAGIIFRFGHR